MKVEYEVDLHAFIQWLREHSYKVGYSRLIYIYSTDGTEAKQFLNRLMYLDLTSEWERRVSFVEFQESIDDLVSELKEVHKCGCS